MQVTKIECRENYRFYKMKTVLDVSHILYYFTKSRYSFPASAVIIILPCCLETASAVIKRTRMFTSNRVTFPFLHLLVDIVFKTVMVYYSLKDDDEEKNHFTLQEQKMIT